MLAHPLDDASEPRRGVVLSRAEPRGKYPSCPTCIGRVDLCAVVQEQGRQLIAYLDSCPSSSILFIDPFLVAGRCDWSKTPSRDCSAADLTTSDVVNYCTGTVS